MTQRKITPGMTKILVQAAAREDGDAQMFTNTDAQGMALLNRGLTARDEQTSRIVITQAGRDLVAGA